MAARNEPQPRCHLLVPNPPDFGNLSVERPRRTTRRWMGKNKLSRVNSSSCVEYLAVNGIVNPVEEQPTVVINLESPAITIRGLFIFSWILVILVPFPFYNYLVEKEKMEKGLLAYQPMLKSMADAGNINGQRLQTAFLIAIGLVFAALLLRTLAHFLSVAVGLPQKKELKTEI